MEYYKIPTKAGAQIQLKTQVRDALSSLDVVWTNMYENEKIDIQFAMEKEAEFYRGAPPQWLNFYLAEYENRPFVKRDKYIEIQGLIEKKRMKHWSISTIDLFHEPGSGGTTLAMQVLWDLRKKFRCARLNNSTTDPKAIAQQILNLFNANQLQNTVLLLLDYKDMDTNEDKPFKSVLEKNLISEIKQRCISTDIPVIIILNCCHQNSTSEEERLNYNNHHTGVFQRHKARQKQESVMLCRCLSEEEQHHFEMKNTQVVQGHGLRHTTFHAFNIMQSNFSQNYVTEACKFLQPIKRKRRPRKAQLLSFLALINSYVPGSYLTEDMCLKFINKKDDIFGCPTLEEQMEPFSDLLVMFSAHAGEATDRDRRIQFVHPMIADECLRLITKAGLTLSDTTRKLIACQSEIPQHLEQIIKQLLTKRERRVNKLDAFSKLIQDVEANECNTQCVRLFKDATNKFAQVAVFPQALARFYYSRMTDYARASYWAKKAIERDQKNSFIRDTLGQVYKNQLTNQISYRLRLETQDILQIGKLALKAFEDEADIAKQEQEPGLQEDGVKNIPTIFNNRGLFGIMQVANSIFYTLTNVNKEWADILTRVTKSNSFIYSQNCGKYQSLLTTLRQRVEDKFNFFEMYLTYSNLEINKKDPSYIWPNIKECYVKFIKEERQTARQLLQEKMASTFAGLLSTPENKSDSELEEITKQWRKIHDDNDDDDDSAINFILANIILSQKSTVSEVLLEELQNKLQKLWEKQKHDSSPEFYLLVLLLFWPDDVQTPDNPNTPDLKKCVQDMRQAYERMYQIYLRSRYLVPHFFFGNGGGLQRVVHRSKLGKADLDHLTKGDESVEIQGLQRIRGEVRNHKVFVLREKNQIEVSAHSPASVCKPGLVSFYLGFTIKGPVAFNIRYVVHAVSFVDTHKDVIIENVTNVTSVIDDLLPLIGKEKCLKIREAPTNKDKMRKLYSFLLSRDYIKDTLYQSLLKNEPTLIEHLVNSG